jgi:hypothetical protein
MEQKNRFRMAKMLGIAVFNLICIFSIIYVIAMGGEKRQAIGEETGVKYIKEFEGTKKIEPVSVAPAAKPPQAPAAPAAAAVSPSAQAYQSKDFLLVDDFTGEEIKNRLGSRANVYTRAPSRIMISRRDDIINGARKKVLMIKYDKKNTGGPNGMGGWCGYYTLIKNEKTGEYLNGAGYKNISFWVKGEKGVENFMVGLADEHWDKIGDSLKSEEIGVYLPGKKITTEWQKAKVPLDVFFVDHENLSSISINFEADCFPEGAGAGSVFISDIALEK